MSYINFLTKEFKMYLNTLKQDLRNRRDPDFFEPFGTQVHCGRQGSGKTISAVHIVNKLKARYPKAILVSNLSLSGYRAISTAEWLRYNGRNQTTQGSDSSMSFSSGFDSKKDYIHFDTVDSLHVALTQINNDYYGVIYLIDEIHTFFNSLDSKNTPIYIFTEISQQRKQRKLIIGTSQLFLRLSKPFREQCDTMIHCSTYGGILTVMRAYDGMNLEQTYDGQLIGSIKRTGFFFHSEQDRNSFDTFQKVVSSDLQFEDSRYLNKKQYKGLNNKK